MLIINNIKNIEGLHVVADRQRNSTTDNIVRDIIESYKNKNLVPVIGEDMYEYENPDTKERQPLHYYIVEEILKHYAGENDIIISETELDKILNEGYFGLSLLQNKIGKDIFKQLYYAVTDRIQNVKLKEEVAAFINAGNFPLLVTTSCFRILETELDGNYVSIWNQLGQKNETPLPEKCVFHLFGEAQHGNSNWGYTEKQLLRFLKLAYSEYPLKNLTTALNGKNLLILGNNTPDWLFRFMLTPIMGGEVYDDRIGYYISSDKKRDEFSLNHFLRDIKFETETQLIEVISNVTKYLKQTNQDTQSKALHGKTYDIFIAHASEDNEVVEKLVSLLREKDLNVWVDYAEIKDGEYWKRIIDAIQNSAYIFPIVSEAYIMKIKKRKLQKEKIIDIYTSELIDFDATKACHLAKELSGVCTELLLAERWLSETRADVYSVPIYLSGESIMGIDINPEYIERVSKDSQLLPQELFYGIQMYEFDNKNSGEFKLDYGRYKFKL